MLLYLFNKHCFYAFICTYTHVCIYIKHLYIKNCMRYMYLFLQASCGHIEGLQSHNINLAVSRLTSHTLIRQ